MPRLGGSVRVSYMQHRTAWHACLHACDQGLLKTSAASSMPPVIRMPPKPKSECAYWGCRRRCRPTPAKAAKSPPRGMIKSAQLLGHVPTWGCELRGHRHTVTKLDICSIPPHLILAKHAKPHYPNMKRTLAGELRGFRTRRFRAAGQTHTAQ